MASVRSEHALNSVSVAAGDQVRDVAAKRVRLSASNSGSGSQTVDAWLLLRGS